MSSTTSQVRAFGRVHWAAGVASFGSQDGGFVATIVTAAPGHCTLTLAPSNLAAEISTRVAIGGTQVQAPADALTFSAGLTPATGAIECAILAAEAGPSAYTDRDFWIEVTSYYAPSLQT